MQSNFKTDHSFNIENAQPIPIEQSMVHSSKNTFLQRIDEYFHLKLSDREDCHNGEESFLEFLNDIATSEQFLAESKQHAIETMIKSREIPEIPYWIKLLENLAYFPHNHPAKWQNFDNYLFVVKTIINALPDELLTLETHKLGISMFGTSYTPLSLCVEYLLKLYEANRNRPFESYKGYREMCKRWKEEIIDPLLVRGSNPNLGTCLFDKLPLHSARLVEYLPPDIDDVIASLTIKMLEMTSNIDQPDKLGRTPLAIAVLREFPQELILDLGFVKQGANVNVCYKKNIYSKTSQPLICHLIEAKMYEQLELMLNLGANPNLTPAQGPFVFSRDKPNETWLSGYQLAVALDDERAIAIIKNVSLQRGVELITDLMPIEQNRDKHEHNQKLKYEGEKLQLECKNRLFTSPLNFLVDLQNKFNIRCYASGPSDKETITHAIEWLFEQAGRSSAAKFWNLAAAYLQQECEKNPRFKVIVSEAASQVVNLGCAGLLANEAIHITSNMSEAITVETLAHEIGHLVDSKIFKMHSLFSCINEHVKEFEKAISTDLQNLTAITADSWVQERVKDFTTQYKGKITHEYFTFVFFELPIHYAFNNQEADEQDLLRFMHHHFPLALQWYETREALLFQKACGMESEDFSTKACL